MLGVGTLWVTVVFASRHPCCRCYYLRQKRRQRNICIAAIEFSRETHRWDSEDGDEKQRGEKEKESMQI